MVGPTVFPGMVGKEFVLKPAPQPKTTSRAPAGGRTTEIGFATDLAHDEIVFRWKLRSFRELRDLAVRDADRGRLLTPAYPDLEGRLWWLRLKLWTPPDGNLGLFVHTKGTATSSACTVDFGFRVEDECTATTVSCFKGQGSNLRLPEGLSATNFGLADALTLQECEELEKTCESPTIVVTLNIWGLAVTNVTTEVGDRL